MENFVYYDGLDSFGYDIIYHPNKSVKELIKICDEIPSAVGFNTYGYIKYRIEEDSKFIKLNNGGLYIKKDKCRNLLDEKKKMIIDLLGTTKSNLTFTITTCKRLHLFIRTMDMFILNCNDVHIIDEWLCVDDNSTEKDRDKMNTLYPFFKFIFKEPIDKGHQKSMNIILDNVKTDYAFQFEDDWICYNTFYVEEYLKMIRENEFNHIIMRWIGGRHNLYKKNQKYDIYKYVYNPGHDGKPRENCEYDKKHDYPVEKMGKNIGWWWAGFSLNPSVYNIGLVKKYIGKFNEIIPTELFEYDYALRCHKYGYKIGLVNMNIQHIGKISSYTLNGTHRYYDKVI